MPTGKIGIHIFLLIFTFLSLTFREYLVVLLFNPDWTVLSEIFSKEWMYSVPLLLILFAHEMGHYIPARRYGIACTLPYFIPFPFGPIGTMGAVIKILQPITDKKKLFDIGFGGPAASLILSSICWVVGVQLSDLTPIDNLSNKENILFFGDSVFTFWSGQWILGPYDSSQFDILIHPLARAGWVGLLVTAINLIPFGQLDGGHIIYAVFGERYRNWIYKIFIGFLLLSLVNISWLLWAFIIYFLIKIEHPFVPDANERLGKFRNYSGIIILASLIFIFIPQPIWLGGESGQTTLLGDLIRWFGLNWFR